MEEQCGSAPRCSVPSLMKYIMPSPHSPSGFFFQQYTVQASSWGRQLTLLLTNFELSESRISGWPLQPWQAVAGPPGILNTSCGSQGVHNWVWSYQRNWKCVLHRGRVSDPWQYRLYQGIVLAFIGTTALLVKTRRTKQLYPQPPTHPQH